MIGTLDWATVRAATAIGKTFGYFDIPAFSFDSGWLGASVIVAQYNLSASRSFVFRNRPTKPTGVTYQLCVRFRIGSTVYRYALWTHNDSTLVAPLYNGEVIKPNFCFELWSVSSSTNMSQATPIRIYTSLMQLVTDFTATPADYADATAALNSDEYNQNIYTLPATNLLAQYKASAGVTIGGSGFVTAWANQVSGSFNFVGTGSLVYFAAGPNGLPYIAVTGAQLLAACALAGLNRGLIYAVVRQPSWNVSANVLVVANNASANCVSIVQYPTTPKLAGLIGAATLTGGTDSAIGEWHMVSLGFDVANQLIYLQIDDLPIVSANAATQSSDLLYLTACDFAELVIYSSGSQLLGPGFSEDVKNYLAARFALSYPLPASFSNNSSWLDNT